MAATSSRLKAPLQWSVLWLSIWIMLTLFHRHECMKVPRKSLALMTPMGSSFPVPVTVAAPTTSDNDTSTLEPKASSVLPLDENKKSLAKIKLQQENLNGKKQKPSGTSEPNEDMTHLLGYNGTGVRKDIPSLGDSVNKSSVGLTKPLGATENPIPALTSSTIVPETSTRDPISDAINIDTIQRTEAELNSTLQEYNITKTFEDHHSYYKSTWSSEKTMSDEFWNKITANLTVNSLLSNSHRRATTMLLSFDFPFYGFPIRNITIASGGFLYTGDYVHSWLASTQYIAPLMANFDTALSNSSLVKYRDDGETFTVVWENVILQDRPNNGSFTFSVTLNKSGDIVFAYRKIPINIREIFDNPLTKSHPVKIGLSDAYIIDKTLLRTKQKTIYEYHRVNFGQSEVQNNTIITLTALPTCYSFKDCDSCITHEKTDFECLWCPTINRCSTGTDRKRQEWVHKGCETTTISELAKCPAIGQKGNNYGESTETTTKPADDSNANGNDRKQPSQKVQPSQSASPNGTNPLSGPAKDNFVNKAHIYHGTDVHGGSSNNLVVSMLVVMTILLTCGGWLLYAYRNPHTKSGQFLIRYRPSKWLWRRGEARYTAATIHM